MQVGYQNEADKFFIFIAACIVTTMVAHVLGFAISAGAPSLNISLAIAPVVLIPLLILGGFFLNDDSVPYWFIWFVLSPLTFSRILRGWHGMS
jgi:ATP-binding cassette subfamily G (WHITE) protein 1